jgi:arylsulfatase A-like enzyme
VVVFLADDAGWGDYSQSGNQQVSTPHIDSIAQGGVSLDRFYVCPVCAPTRGEFLTGRYHPRGGVRGVSTGQERLDLDEKTIADAFKAAGYATGAFGKWHNGSQWPYHPMARGFDEYFGHSSGHWGEYFDAPLEDNGRMVRTTGYIVDVCTDRAISFIDRNKKKPFFCFVPFLRRIHRGPRPRRIGSVSKIVRFCNEPQIHPGKYWMKLVVHWPWSRTRIATWDAY